MMSKPSELAPQTNRLVFSRFTEADAPAFAHVLSDPEVTRSIMAKATTPEQCLKCARERIAWHNSSWNGLGFGVWALREKVTDGPQAGPIIGWCGLTSTSHGTIPEILYGFSRARWGGGLATEAASATIDWAFRGGICDGIDAVIFGALNPGSSAVVEKLGFKRTGTMTFDEFLPELKLGRDVLDYEIWRLREGICLDFEALLFQAPFKSGLVVSARVADATEILPNLLSAAKQRQDRPSMADAEIEQRIETAFRRGLNECNLDLYHISRTEWVENRFT